MLEKCLAVACGVEWEPFGGLRHIGVKHEQKSAKIPVLAQSPEGYPNTGREIKMQRNKIRCDGTPFEMRTVYIRSLNYLRILDIHRQVAAPSSSTIIISSPQTQLKVAY